MVVGGVEGVIAEDGVWVFARLGVVVVPYGGVRWPAMICSGSVL